MSDNKNLKKSKLKRIIEVKFENEKNIAIAKSSLASNMKLLNSQIKEAKRSRGKLKRELLKEKSDLNKKIALKAVLERKNIVDHQKLIKSNQLLLKDQIINMRFKVKKQQEDIKNSKIVQRKMFNEKLASAKSNFIKAKADLNIEINNLKGSHIKNKIKLENSIIKSKKSNEEKRKRYVDEINLKKLEMKKLENDFENKKKASIQRIKDIEKEKILTFSQIQYELKQEVKKQKRLTTKEILNIKLLKQETINKIKLGEIQKDIVDKIDKNKSISQRNLNKINIEEEKLRIKNIERDFKTNMQTNKEEVERLLEIDIKNPVSSLEFQAIRGKVAKQVGKSAMRLYERLNGDYSAVSIDKLSFSKEAIEDIKLFRKLKDEDQVTDIRRFIEYTNFISGIVKTKEDVEKEIVSPIVEMYKGKVFSFLNNYFWIEKVSGLRVVKASQFLTKSRKSLISLNDDEWERTFEKEILDKLKKGLCLKLTENIAIKQMNKKMVVVTDTPFMR